MKVVNRSVKIQAFTVNEDIRDNGKLASASSSELTPVSEMRKGRKFMNSYAHSETWLSAFIILSLFLFSL
jgi:hypothetical protein